MLMADVFAYASGLLLLAHTRRIALFALDARQLMQALDVTKFSNHVTKSIKTKPLGFVQELIM